MQDTSMASLNSGGSSAPAAEEVLLAEYVLVNNNNDDPVEESAEAAAANANANVTSSSSSSKHVMKFNINTEFTEGGYLSEQHANAVVVPSILAPQALDTKERTPMCLTLVVDVSGSMAGEKLKLVAKTIEFVADKLTERDMLGIIAYDTNVYETLKLTLMTQDGKERAHNAAKSLRSGSTTNLSGGLFAGIRQQLAQRVIIPPDDEHERDPPAPMPKKRRSPRKQNQAGGTSSPSLFSSWFVGASQPHQQKHAAEWQALFPADAAAAPAAVPLDEERTPIPNGMIRAIHLFTDGHANCGETNMDKLAEKASQMLDSATPISVSTFGFGADHNEDALQKLALCSGEYNFVPNAAAIPRAFGGALGGLLSVIAQQVYVELEASAPGAYVEAPIDPDLARTMERLASGGVRVRLDDVCTEEQRDVPFRVSLPANQPDAHIIARLKYIDASSSSGEVTMEATQVLKRVTDVKYNKINLEVEVQRLRLEAATLMEEAELAARAGNGEEARAKLADAEHRIITSPAANKSTAVNILEDVRTAQRYSSDVRMMSKAAAMGKGCARKQKGANFSTPSRARVSRQAEEYTTNNMMA